MQRNNIKPAEPTKVLHNIFSVAVIERNHNPDPNSNSRNEWLCRTFGKLGVIHKGFQLPPEVQRQMNDPEVTTFFCIVRVVQELRYGSKGSVVIIHPLMPVHKSEVLTLNESGLIINLNDQHLELKAKDPKIQEDNFWTVMYNTRSSILEKSKMFSLYPTVNEKVKRELMENPSLAAALSDSDMFLSSLDMCEVPSSTETEEVLC